MLVIVCMPCEKERWSTNPAFGFLADDNTCVFRHPLCKQRSGRLFLKFLIAHNETLTDHQAGIPISIASHPTRLTEHERRTRGISFGGLACRVSSDKRMTTRTFSTRIARAYSAGDDSFIPRFVLCVLEDASLHPVGTFRVPPMAILAPLGFEIAQMLKHQDGRLVLFGKLDNARTHQVCQVLIPVPDLAPQVCIVLFALRNDASLGSRACDPS